jgi:hypothetical protein
MGLQAVNQTSWRVLPACIGLLIPATPLTLYPVNL